jgi:hypothetical protein
MADVGLETDTPTKITADQLWYKDAVIYQAIKRDAADAIGLLRYDARLSPALVECSFTRQFVHAAEFATPFCLRALSVENM